MKTTHTTVIPGWQPPSRPSAGLPLLLAVLSLLGLLAQAATPGAGPGKLRQLARLPQMDMQVQFIGYTTDEGFAVLSDPAEQRLELQQLKQALRGDDTDGERLVRIAQLQGKLGKREESKATRERAAAMLKKRSESEPQNGRVWSALAEALADSAKPGEQESLFRRGVQLSPDDAELKITLSSHLMDQSLRILLGADELPTNAAPTSTDLLGRVLERPPSASEVERSRKLMGEALELSTAAIRVAPTNAEAWARRGICHSFHTYSRETLRLAESIRTTSRPPDPMEAMAALFPAECTADFRKAAELDPGKPRRIMAASMAELIRASLARKELAFGTPESWSILPEQVRVTLRADLERLLRLAESTDPRIAAAGAECAGMMQFMAMHDLPGALVNLRHAVKLNPEREPAWEMCMAIFVSEDKYAELLPVAEERLRLSDTPRNHIIVAKVLEKLDKTDQAAPHVKEAYRQASTDVLANLSMAALILRQSHDDDDLTPVVTHLVRAGHAMGSSPSPKNLIDLQVLRALYYALGGKIEMARQIIHKVLEFDKDNEWAKEVLAALAATRE